MSKTIEISSLPFLPKLTDQVVRELKELEERGIENIIFGLEDGITMILQDNLGSRHMLGRLQIFNEDDQSTVCDVDFKPNKYLALMTPPPAYRCLLYVQAEEDTEDFILSSI